MGFIKKVAKIVKIFFIAILSLFLIIWLAALMKCEVLTLLHREEFETIYRENTMLGEIDYLKVLEYSEEYARVYYVSENRSAGDILSFVKQGDKWKYDYWETVWSATGSASEVIWPYWWHFIYGGL